MIGSSNTIDLADADAFKVLGYLLHKNDHDVGFFEKYSYDEHFHLQNLVWPDAHCQLYYSSFGHAIAFDTTYKTNGYGKPLLI